MAKESLIPLICCFGFNLALTSWQLPTFGLRGLVKGDMGDEWNQFKKEYNKTYIDENEELRRRLYWEDTLRFIWKHNLKFDRGEVSYSLGENEFADLAEDEFENIYTKKTAATEPEIDENIAYMSDKFTNEHVDWRQHGLVTSVKNQGRCANSWIIAPLESLEGVYKKTKGGKLRSLSVQNVMDCSKSVSCRGGYVPDVYRYIADNGGIDDDECYNADGIEYFERTQTTSGSKCRYKESCKAATCNGYKRVQKNERSLANAVASVGPVAIAMDVNNRAFWFYKKGIYYNRRCSKTRTNHDMLVVGFGSVRIGRDYWIIKNSWGKSWGDRGYVFVARNRDNMCGIASSATYPTV